MKVRFSTKFERSYVKAPSRIQRLFDQKLVFLLQDFRHPSLRAKKYDESKGIWQARVSRDHRFYFCIEGDTYFILAITRHPK